MDNPSVIMKRKLDNGWVLQLVYWNYENHMEPPPQKTRWELVKGSVTDVVSDWTALALILHRKGS